MPAVAAAVADGNAAAAAANGSNGRRVVVDVRTGVPRSSRKLEGALLGTIAAAASCSFRGRGIDADVVTGVTATVLVPSYEFPARWELITDSGVSM